MSQRYEDAFEIVEILRKAQGRCEKSELRRRSRLALDRFDAAHTYLAQRKFISSEPASDQQSETCVLELIGNSESFKDPFELFYYEFVLELSSLIGRNVALDRLTGTADAPSAWTSIAISRLESKGHVLPHDSNRRRAGTFDAVMPRDTIAEEILRITYTKHNAPSTLSLNMQVLAGTGNTAIIGHGNTVTDKHSSNDTEILEKFARVLDRPCFTTPFHCESSLPAFKQAITDTIQAINTGIWQTREGKVIEHLPSRHDIKDPTKRESLAHIERLLVQLRTDYEELVKTSEIREDGCDRSTCSIYILSPSAVSRMNSLRAELLSEFQSAYPQFRAKVGMLDANDAAYPGADLVTRLGTFPTKGEKPRAIEKLRRPKES